MIEHKESKTRDIPLWLTAVVILLCIGGGVWLVKWYMQTTPRQVVEIPEDKNPVANQRSWRGFGQNNNGGSGSNNGRGNRGNRDINSNGVQSWSNNSYRIKTGDTIITVNYSGNKFDLSPRYLNVQKVEGAELVMMRLGILTDPGWREYLNVTDAQLDKLRAVPLPRSETLDPADKKHLSELWKAYHGASGDAKTAAEKKLLAAVEEVGKKNRAATVAFEVSRAEQVRAALTPEQIKKYKATGGTLPKEPKTVPVKPEPTKVETKAPAGKTVIDKQLGASAKTDTTNKSASKATTATITAPSLAGGTGATAK
jgi:hypothetical protein